MKRFYQGLSDQQLREEIDTLKTQLEEAEEILSKRKGIELFKCGECGLKDKDDEVIFQHLLDVHRYPEEDAGYTIERVFE